MTTATELILKAEKLEARSTWDAMNTKRPEAYQAESLRRQAERIRKINWKTSIRKLVGW